MMSNTKQQNQPDPVEMLYIESPSISLKQFREAIDRLVTEARIDAVTKFISYSTSKHNAFTKELLEEKHRLQSQLTNKEEK